MSRIRVFHLDTGGCGACAAEVWAAVETSPELTWAPGPAQADVVAITGAVTPAAREVTVALYRRYWQDRVPVLAIGRCAVDGYPFGRLGVAAVEEIVPQGTVQSCPPSPSIVRYALVGAVQQAGLDI